MPLVVPVKESPPRRIPRLGPPGSSGLSDSGGPPSREEVLPTPSPEFVLNHYPPRLRSLKRDLVRHNDPPLSDTLGSPVSHGFPSVPHT